MAVSKKQLIAHMAAKLSKDYETTTSQSDYSLKKQCDRLASYAYIAMKHLEDNDMLDFILLKHDDLHSWYKGHKESIRKEDLAREAKLRKAELRERALLKLSEEERIALGLRR